MRVKFLTACEQIPGKPVRCSGSTQCGTVLCARRSMDPACVQRAVRYKVVCKGRANTSRPLPDSSDIRNSTAGRQYSRRTMGAVYQLAHRVL